ncbi:MAG: biotin transporter BioY [Heliobacteriaceae bacterium]|nr:biotin transporter BioY [Heliobacteriaceae bacterium]MDD4588600.1 biotin transporter BioY [Heliobacteriaceae bacterium]
MRFTHRDLAFAALFTALTAIGAFIKIPIPFVPFTLQFFFVLLAGTLLGSRLALLSQVAYLIIGLIGVPVFAMGGGPSYVLQPTFGYLVGFAGTAYLVGRLTKTGQGIRFKRCLLVNLAGLAVTYVCGIIHLYVIVNFVLGQALPFSRAVWLGAVVCSPGDIILSFIAATVSVKLAKSLPSIGPKPCSMPKKGLMLP